MQKDINPIENKIVRVGVEMDKKFYQLIRVRCVELEMSVKEFIHEATKLYLKVTAKSENLD